MVTIAKDISTLVSDIYALLDPNYDHDFDEQNVENFGRNLAKHIRNRLAATNNQRPSLRLSNIGTKCRRKLWYSINTPEKAEPLSAAARFKFLFGDILEELLLFLGAEAGHAVEGQQDELDINGVKGHRDAIIDGRLVDCKSASTFSFKKFASNGLREEDPFGYLDQIGAYLEGSQRDPRLKDKDVASFLVVDKTLGNICLDTYPKTETDYSAKVGELRKMLAKPEPPDRQFAPVPEGKSGNQKLCTYCSYCDFKKTCYPELRTYIYSNGPTFLTKVVKEPRVLEATI
jgi:hypothetical protein